MDPQPKPDAALDSIPANRRMIEELSARKLISAEARESGLRLLYPARQWGLWAARMLLVFGVALVLAGVVYFFAFNWAKIAPGLKLGMIQAAILGCLGAAYFSGLKQLAGKILLLCATVFVGVFLAVFGQIYQTGADAYNLFMMWAILTLHWVAISGFAALWAVWLVVANTFLILYWNQAVTPGPPWSR